MSSNHTPGPWMVGKHRGVSHYIVHKESDLIVATMRATQCTANAARIVACVNACEASVSEACDGLKDPERDIPNMRRALQLIARNGLGGDHAAEMATYTLTALGMDVYGWDGK